MLKKSSLKNSLYCLNNFAYTYLGPCLLFRVLGMNPRHSSHSKFLLAVLVTSFFVVLVFSLDIFHQCSLLLRVVYLLNFLPLW